MLDKVKLALRIKSEAFDVEIIDLINACKHDLRLSGINAMLNGHDALIQRAIILYCKANFGYGDEKEKFSRAYEALKTSLSLAGDYTDA